MLDASRPRVLEHVTSDAASEPAIAHRGWTAACVVTHCGFGLLFLAIITNQQAAAATLPISCGQTLREAINPAGETDIFMFVAGGGETVTISTPGTIPQQPFRPCWQLLAPPPVPGPPQALGGQTCGQGERTLPRPGTYIIKVLDGNGNDDTGAYSVTLESVSGDFNGMSNAPPAPTCGYPDVLGNPDDGTRPIACGETKTGNVEVGGETDTYTFVAAGGETVAISTPGTIPQQPFRPCWQL